MVKYLDLINRDCCPGLTGSNISPCQHQARRAREYTKCADLHKHEKLPFQESSRKWSIEILDEIPI